MSISWRRSAVWLAIVASMLFSRSTRAQPNFIATRLGECFGKFDPTKAPPTEITRASHAVHQCPKSSLTHALLGQALLKNGRVDDALKQFDAAAKFNTDWDTATKNRVEWLRMSLRGRAGNVSLPTEAGASSHTAGSAPTEQPTWAVAAGSESTAHADADTCPTISSFPASAGVDPGDWGSLVSLVNAGCEIGSAFGGGNSGGSKTPSSPSTPMTPPQPACLWRDCVIGARGDATRASVAAGMEFMSCLSSCDKMRGDANAYGACVHGCATRWRQEQDVTITGTFMGEMAQCNATCSGRPSPMPLSIVQKRSDAIDKKAQNDPSVCKNFDGHEDWCFQIAGCGWCDEPTGGKCLAGTPLGSVFGPPQTTTSTSGATFTIRLQCPEPKWYYENPGFVTVTPDGN